MLKSWSSLQLSTTGEPGLLQMTGTNVADCLLLCTAELQAKKEKKDFWVPVTRTGDLGHQAP
jgi:hypothetical protein